MSIQPLHLVRSEGWGQEGKRVFHYYRAGMPICYQRAQYRAQGWRFTGPLKRSAIELGNRKRCMDCTTFRHQDTLAPELRGYRPEDDD